MRTIKGGPADKAGKEFSINPDTAIEDGGEDDFNEIINSPRITRVIGSARGWKNENIAKKGGHNDHQENLQKTGHDL